MVRLEKMVLSIEMFLFFICLQVENSVDSQGFY